VSIADRRLRIVDQRIDDLAIVDRRIADRRSIVDRRSVDLQSWIGDPLIRNRRSAIGDRHV
jgi:hypothetical protein